MRPIEVGAEWMWNPLTPSRLPIVVAVVAGFCGVIAAQANLLPLVTVTGRVVLLDVQRIKPAFVDVSYEASWHCEFYRLADCMLGIGHLALSTPIGPDGAFTVRIQDFAHDPALGRFSSRGSFSFNLNDAAGDLVNGLGLSPGIPSQGSVASDPSRLPSPLVLYPYPRR